MQILTVSPVPLTSPRLTGWASIHCYSVVRPLFLFANRKMKVSARIYNCARCGCQVVLCSHCDRGNIYCLDGCSTQARRETLREAGKRYQETIAGRLNNAKRQAQYRIRQALFGFDSPMLQEKVTHHSSGPLLPAASMGLDEQRGKKGPSNPFYRCHGCGRAVSPYYRQGYLRRVSKSSRRSSSFQHQA